jgi:hypothetical protein
MKMKSWFGIASLTLVSGVFLAQSMPPEYVAVMKELGK